MVNVLEQLKAGIRRFQNEIYPEQAEMYRKAVMVPQRPDALVVTCADSRIDVEQLTQAAPGELFVARNIGNMVPAYGEMMGGVSAVLEYAVTALKVKHLVVCGHTDCGAMKALLNPETVESMPTVKSWLRNAHTALSVAEALNQNETARDGAGRDRTGRGETVRGGTGRGDLLRLVTEQNILLQMQHVRTHPSVAGAMARGELTISGWLYDIAHGEVLICEEGGRTFEALGAAGPGKTLAAGDVLS